MRTLLTLLILSLVGCSTYVEVAPYTTKQDGAINGIPFRVMAAHTVRVYKMDPTSGRYEQVHVKSVNLPMRDQLYTLNYWASIFANPQFEVTFNTDNSIKMLDVTGDGSLDKAISAAGLQAVAASNAATEFENMKRAAKQGRLASEGNLVLSESTFLTNQLTLLKARSALSDLPGSQISNQEVRLEAALKARQVVEAAEHELTTASTTEMPNAVAKVQILRLQANHAYRSAGLAEPYPGIFP